MYYFVRDEKVFQLDPMTQKVSMPIQEEATSVISTPNGIAYSTPENKVLYLLFGLWSTILLIETEL